MLVRGKIILIPLSNTQIFLPGGELNFLSDLEERESEIDTSSIYPGNVNQLIHYTDNEKIIKTICDFQLSLIF